MIWAINNGERTKATPSMEAVCPCCGGKVKSKCGNIKIWHWAHQTNECDPWYEPESEWHLNWKSKFLPEQQEVVIGKHRADVKVNDLVVELQNSAINQETIKEREMFYGKMIWIINARKFNIEFKRKKLYRCSCGHIGGLSGIIIHGEPIPCCKNCSNTKKDELALVSKESYASFRWKHPHKNWIESQKTMFWDFGDNEIFNVKKIYLGEYVGGYGHFLNKDIFLALIHNPNLPMLADSKGNNCQ